MVNEGIGALRRYPGLATSLYAAQLVTSLIFAWAATNMLATVFARQPLFDQAVDGDLAALIFVLRDSPDVFTSIFWSGAATVLGYMVLSWYLVGGLNAVLIQRPGARREVAATFGAGGAVSFFAYTRLWLLCLAPYAVIAGALVFGATRVSDSLFLRLLTVSDVVWALIPRLAPGVVLLWIQVTAVDYARIELSREPGLAARHALVRGYRMVFTDWRPLVHLLLYAAWFVAITWVFVLFTQGQTMPGAAGAMAIVAIRQAVAVARFCAAMVCAGGQVVYTVLRARAHDESAA
jgi:hypothetical protein